MEAALTFARPRPAGAGSGATRVARFRVARFRVARFRVARFRVARFRVARFSGHGGHLPSWV
jgi:hypothetical protein